MTRAARVAIRFIGTPGIVAGVGLLIYLDHQAGRIFFVALLVAGAGLGSLAELYRLFRIKGYRPEGLLGMAALAAILLGPMAGDRFEPAAAAAILVGALLVLLVLRHPQLTPESAAVTLLGFAYVGMLQFVYVGPAYVERTWAYLVFLLVASKLPDTIAYLVGKSFGRRRMAPVLSPNKTWEGGIAGFAAGTAGGVAVALQAEPFAVSHPLALLIPFCALVTLAGMVGDLTKSALKRWAGVKDSGFIPEFGGFLDIVDSFLLSAPAAALGLWLIRPA